MEKQCGKEEIRLEEEMVLKELKHASPLLSPKGNKALNPLNVDLIIKKLLSYLPLPELKAAREVNRNWNRIATQFFYPYCSRCKLSFNEENYWTNMRNYGIEEMKDFIHLVVMSGDCPFTVYDVGTSIIKSNNEGVIAEFFEVCGPYIEELTIREDETRKIFLKGFPDRMYFENLRTLGIHILNTCPETYKNYFSFITHIMTSSPNLERIILSSHLGTEEVEVGSLLESLQMLQDKGKLVSLQIEAQMNESQLIQLSTAGLKLTDFRVDFWGSQLVNPRGLKRFLESQSDTLETFKLSDVAMSSICVVEFPCMRQLRSLKIKGSMLGRISVSFPHVSFVDQFPRLKTLSFSETFGEWEDFLKTGMKPSDTVEELKVPCDFVDSLCLQRAAFIFPKLKRLEVPHYPNIISVVYDMMPQLEELSINTKYISLVDDLITGIPSDLCMEIHNDQSYERVLQEIEDYRTAKPIVCLKNLKKLKLKCKRTSDPVELTEVSFYLGLFLMDSLTCLDFGLRPLMLSRDCLELVKARFDVISLHTYQ